MDTHTHAWMRAWLMGAATAGLIGPHLLAGEGYRPAAKPAKSSAPALLPYSGAVQPAAHQQTGNGDITLAESEVEQQLRLLYERDGREMPDMKLTPAPAAQPSAPGQTSSVPAAPRTQQAPQPRYSSAPPAAPKANPNKVASFFKKMIPGGSKKPQTAKAAPRQLPPAPPAAPAYQPTQPNYGQPVVAPQGSPQPLPVPAQPAVTIAPNPVRTVSPVTYGNPTQNAAQPFSPAPTATFEEPVSLPMPADESETPFGVEEADIPLIPDSPSEEMFEEPVTQESAQDEASPVEAAPPRLNDDFPDPFGAVTDPEAAPEEEEETNPYLGKSLDEQEEPATLSDSPDFEPVATEPETPVEDPTTVKMRRIIQRADMKGLKGFCPVTLRDHRELADSKPEFGGSYRGQKFFFASKVAQAKFEEDPARYAPAAYGADVVVLTDAQDVVEGTLDYAAWYKGRLYLFSTQATHDTFVADPDRYATPPGIE